MSHPPTAEFGDARAAHGHFWDEVHGLIRAGARRWVDVGGAGNPVLTAAQLEKWGLDYTILDVSRAGLERAPQPYNRVCASILDAHAVEELTRERGPFDAVVSRWTAEHVPDGKGFHEAVFEMLAPGASAVHLFPTLYALPFLANRILPEAASTAMLSGLCSGRKAKYPAHYDWCRGPSARQIERLEGIGYSVQRYVGYFGHNFYDRYAPLRGPHHAVTRLLVRHPVAALTSFAVVVLRRPP